jgi:hypothetical protein
LRGISHLLGGAADSADALTDDQLKLFRPNGTPKIQGSYGEKIGAKVVSHGRYVAFHLDNVNIRKSRGSLELS